MSNDINNKTNLMFNIEPGSLGLILGFNGNFEEVDLLIDSHTCSVNLNFYEFNEYFEELCYNI
jgi:hypothetical protein